MRLGAEQLRPTISLDIEGAPGKKLSQEELFLFGFDIIPDFEEVLGIYRSHSAELQLELGGKQLTVKRSFVKPELVNKLDITWNENGRHPLHAQRATIDLGDKIEEGEKCRVTYRPLGDYRMVGKVKERICYTWDDQPTLDGIRNLLTELKRAREDKLESKTSYKRGVLGRSATVEFTGRTK